MGNARYTAFPPCRTFTNRPRRHGLRPRSPIRCLRLPSGPMVYYERGCASVIGRMVSYISDQRRRKHVAGRTIVNDVSARDIQQPPDCDPTVELSKPPEFSTTPSNPMVPCLVVTRRRVSGETSRSRPAPRQQRLARRPTIAASYTYSGPYRVLSRLPRAASRRRHCTGTRQRWPLLRTIPVPGLDVVRCRSRRHSVADQPGVQ